METLQVLGRKVTFDGKWLILNWLKHSLDDDFHALMISSSRPLYS